MTKDVNYVVLTGKITKIETPSAINDWIELEIHPEDRGLTIPLVAYAIDFGSSEKNGRDMLSLIARDDLDKRVLVIGRVDAGAEGSEIRALRIIDRGSADAKYPADDIYQSNVALVGLIHQLIETYDREDLKTLAPR